MSLAQSRFQDAASARGPACAHCGATCPAGAQRSGVRAFCCAGCRTVFELLADCGLSSFYRWEPQPGRTPPAPGDPGRYSFLDAPDVQARLLDYADSGVARVRFVLPAIHCVACVWLLERLHKIQPGMFAGRVEFARRSVHLTYDPRRLRLSEVASLLDRLGYPPDLRLADLTNEPGAAARVSAGDRLLWARLGVAGFAFGNTMFMALPGYFGFDDLEGPVFQRWFGWISLAFALPSATWCAAPYWRSAWASWRARRVGLDTPIVIGIAALLIQSVAAVAAGGGLSYLDSLTALVFFLLCGRWFQQKTFENLAFDRDFRSFFPMAVAQVTDSGERMTTLARVGVGDRLRIRHGELVPADAVLARGDAAIDYSFVTGESAPVVAQLGDRIYAGGRQTAGAIEVVAVKSVSESYLASLWDQDVFQKRPTDGRESLVDRLGRRFAVVVAVLATGAALAWLAIRPSSAPGVFAAVLIVACPCALALAGPFAYGAAQRRLSGRGIFVRGPRVLEALAGIDAVVFDKTGTLTDTAATCAVYRGAPLTDAERAAVAVLAGQSTHPISRAVAAGLRPTADADVLEYSEEVGRGISGVIGGSVVRLGACSWLAASGIVTPAAAAGLGTQAWLAIDRECRGWFSLSAPLRSGLDQWPARFADCELTLLSGDNDAEEPVFRRWIGPKAVLRFRQTPQDKLDYVRQLGARGRTVMMVGDGLNDAGALQQSDVGVAVVDQAGSFSPASDVVIEAACLARLPGLVAYARRLRGSVRLCLGVSLAYNLTGVALASADLLSPGVTAVLMPLSSATVVLLSCGLAGWHERRALGPRPRTAR